MSDAEEYRKIRDLYRELSTAFRSVGDRKMANHYLRVAEQTQQIVYAKEGKASKEQYGVDGQAPYKLKRGKG